LPNAQSHSAAAERTALRENRAASTPNGDVPIRLTRQNRLERPGITTPHTAPLLIPRLAVAAFFLTSLIVPRSGHAGEPPMLSRERVSGFALLALRAISQEYPNKTEHVIVGPDDVKGPKALHSAFYGSYDWHSSVHGH